MLDSLAFRSVKPGVLADRLLDSPLDLGSPVTSKDDVVRGQHGLLFPLDYDPGILQARNTFPPCSLVPVGSDVSTSFIGIVIEYRQGSIALQVKADRRPVDIDVVDNVRDQPYGHINEHQVKIDDLIQTFKVADLQASNVSSETMESLRKALLALSQDAILPHVSASLDGEVGLSWFTGRDRFEAMIQDQTIVWLAKKGGSVQSGGSGLTSLDGDIQAFVGALGDFYL